MFVTLKVLASLVVWIGARALLRKSVLGLCVLCALCGLTLAQAPEVDQGEVARWGDTVQHIAGDERRGAIGDVFGVPADDNHKWFISVIGSKGCGACARLKADIRADQSTQKHLGAFITLMDGDEMHSDTKKSWSHYNYFLGDDKSQAFRFEALKIKGYPTIVVQPPLNKRFGDPATVVFKREGYDGNPDKLRRDLSAAIKLYVAKLQERRAPAASGGHRAVLPPPVKTEAVQYGAYGQDADGTWGGDPPWQPAPKVDPTPAPAPLPFDLPLEIPPRPTPTPAPDAQPDETPSGPIPQAPEAVIVVDGATSSEDDGCIKQLVDRFKLERPGLVARIKDIRDVKNLPVRKDELPAILVTGEGRVLEKITARLLPLLATPKPAVAPATTPAAAPQGGIL